MTSCRGWTPTPLQNPDGCDMNRSDSSDNHETRECFGWGSCARSRVLIAGIIMLLAGIIISGVSIMFDFDTGTWRVIAGVLVVGGSILFAVACKIPPIERRSKPDE